MASRENATTLAAAIMQSTFLAMVVAGAAVGGLTVALLGARSALGFDAATFVVSALLIKFGVRPGPPRWRPFPPRCVSLAAGYGSCSVTVLCASC